MIMDFLFFPKRTEEWKLLDLPLHKAAFLTFTDMSQEQWCSSDEHLAFQNRYAIPVSTIQDDTSRCPRHSHPLFFQDGRNKESFIHVG